MGTQFSQKTVAATISSLAVSLIIFVLTNYVPYFHHEIPTTLTPLIQAAGAGVGAFVGGYLAKHKATLQEVEAAFAEAEKLMNLKVVAGQTQVTAGTLSSLSRAVAK
jgi:hypothetical protein